MLKAISKTSIALLLLLLIFISQTVPRSSLDRLSPSPFSPFHFEFFTSTLKDIKIKVSVGRNGAAQLKRDQVGFFVLFCLNNKMKNFSASFVDELIVSNLTKWMKKPVAPLLFKIEEKISKFLVEQVCCC
jgi:hypothetical protein